MMFTRSVTRISPRPLRASRPFYRTFVSTVLLSKTYENKTVMELRTELRNRGLSSSGPRATLITRIQRSDAQMAAESVPALKPTPSQSQARSISSSATSYAEVAPNVSVSENSKPTSPPMTLDIQIPDVSEVAPEPQVQVPFLPDFWDSSSMKAKAAGTDALSEDAVTPKIMLASGAETYPAGGPTFAMSPVEDLVPVPLSPSPSTTKKFDGVLGDVLDDLGVPHEVFSPSSSSSQKVVNKRLQNRPLDEEEKRGVYVLLGLLFGAWAVGGLAAPSRGKDQKRGSESKKH